jgi:hypothetical protein
MGTSEVLRYFYVPWQVLRSYMYDRKRGVLKWGTFDVKFDVTVFQQLIDVPISIPRFSPCNFGRLNSVLFSVPEWFSDSNSIAKSEIQTHLMEDCFKIEHSTRLHVRQLAGLIIWVNDNKLTNTWLVMNNFWKMKSRNPNFRYKILIAKIIILQTHKPYNIQAALVIRGFSIRGFDDSRTQKPQITRENCHF